MRYKVPPARLSLMSEDSLWCKIDKNSIILSGVHTLVPIVFPLSRRFSLAGISTPHRGAANVLLKHRNSFRRKTLLRASFVSQKSSTDHRRSFALSSLESHGRGGNHANANGGTHAHANACVLKKGNTNFHSPKSDASLIGYRHSQIQLQNAAPPPGSSIKNHTNLFPRLSFN